MANPILPIQAGASLESLDRDRDIEQTQMSEQEIENLEEALGLEDSGELDEEVIELDDGSVIVNYTPTEGPMKNPEFYANLAETMDEGTLQMLAVEFLDLIEVDREIKKRAR